MYYPDFLTLLLIERSYNSYYNFLTLMFFCAKIRFLPIRALIN